MSLSANICFAHLTTYETNILASKYIVTNTYQLETHVQRVINYPPASQAQRSWWGKGMAAFGGRVSSFPFSKGHGMTLFALNARISLEAKSGWSRDKTAGPILIAATKVNEGRGISLA